MDRSAAASSRLLLLLVGASVISRVHCNPNYREALTKSILFFQGQRSGRLPPTQQIQWRSSSGLTDGHIARVRCIPSQLVSYHLLLTPALSFSPYRIEGGTRDKTK